MRLGVENASALSSDRNMKWIGLSLITFILATGCLAAQPTPDLSGFWTVNVDASDDVEESLEDVGKIRSRKKAGKKGDSPIGSEYTLELFDFPKKTNLIF